MPLFCYSVKYKTNYNWKMAFKYIKWLVSTFWHLCAAGFRHCHIHILAHGDSKENTFFFFFLIYEWNCCNQFILTFNVYFFSCKFLKFATFSSFSEPSWLSKLNFSYNGSVFSNNMSGGAGIRRKKSQIQSVLLDLIHFNLNFN